MRRLKKFIVIVLMLANASGVRLVTRCEAGQSQGFSVSPSKAIKAFARVLTKRERHPTDRRALGFHKVRQSGRDLDGIRSDNRVTPVVVHPPMVAVLQSVRVEFQPDLARRLPTDLSPVQPPHLSSKK
ncbi:MAG: hypothetical protein HZB91_11325 [Elusimicrobia bacterium]|nr:hypothetical protein [Elusimicrobiota bacterium]